MVQDAGTLASLTVRRAAARLDGYGGDRDVVLEPALVVRGSTSGSDGPVHGRRARDSPDHLRQVGRDRCDLVARDSDSQRNRLR